VRVLTSKKFDVVWIDLEERNGLFQAPVGDIRDATGVGISISHALEHGHEWQLPLPAALVRMRVAEFQNCSDVSDALQMVSPTIVGSVESGCNTLNGGHKDIYCVLIRWH
jgi:hypothetical protein